MTKEQKARYRPTKELKEMLGNLAGKKFELECGHHITFGSRLGNSVTIHQVGKNEYQIICSQCGY